MVMPGDNTSIDLESVSENGIPIEIGARFTIRESGNTIGTGIVTQIKEKAKLAISG